jgi:hypothetical protein
MKKEFTEKEERAFHIFRDKIDQFSSSNELISTTLGRDGGGKITISWNLLMELMHEFIKNLRS